MQAATYDRATSSPRARLTPVESVDSGSAHSFRASTALEQNDRDPEIARAVVRAQAGDMEAIRFLYLRYKNNVYGYVLSILRDQHEAEDVTQHVFMKLISVIPKYEPRQVPFTSWILRVARNVAVDHLRQRRPVPCEEVFEPTRAADDSGRDRRWGLEQALQALLGGPAGRRRAAPPGRTDAGRDRDPDGSDRSVDPWPSPPRASGAAARAGQDRVRADRARYRVRSPHRHGSLVQAGMAAGLWPDGGGARYGHRRCGRSALVDSVGHQRRSSQCAARGRVLRVC